MRKITREFLPLPPLLLPRPLILAVAAVGLVEPEFFDRIVVSAKRFGNGKLCLQHLNLLKQNLNHLDGEDRPTFWQILFE